MTTGRLCPAAVSTGTAASLRGGVGWEETAPPFLLLTPGGALYYAFSHNIHAASPSFLLQHHPGGRIPPAAIL